MLNSTSKTYTLKREILTFSNKISRKLTKPEKKFTADMVYGMLASESCLLTDIVDQLHENTKKVNSVERLTRHLNQGVPSATLKSYLSTVRKWVPKEPVIHIDDSDVIKPDGYKFQDLGLVRDGSKSTEKKNVYEKGYHVTEACVITSNNHPVSIFSKVHSSMEKDFTSVNNITFSAMERGRQLFGKATFVMDRGYDDNKMFLKLDELEQDYVIRLTSKRKLIAINALNFYITLCMAFLAQMSMKSESHTLKVAIIQTAAPIKEKVNFCYYRLAEGIAGILSYAKEGVRLWFRTKRPAYRQLCLKLVA